MSIYHVFYNGKANNGKGLEEAEELKSLLPGDEFVFSDVTADTYENLFKKVGDGTVILCGGDGTINRFVNDTKDLGIKNEILYFATGSGNDFLKDTGKKKGELVALNKYIEKLPEVTVGGKTYKFLNNVGFGIDGYCCEVGDKLRATSDKPIDYTGIAIKGLLFYYKPVNATVTVDGVTTEYKKVWLAPTMNGRYYGGGMMPTPDQDRFNKDHTLSVLVMHGSGKLKTLIVFPSIFKGEHIKKTKMVKVMTGKEITVTFDSPTALQIDGETILGVTTYTARAYSEN